jgi:tetratricopeptide (TPR) repeat protein
MQPSATPPTASSFAANKDGAAFVPRLDRRETWMNILRPKGLFHAVAVWFHSRSGLRLALGVPFALLAVTSVAYVRRAQSSPPYRMIPQFEEAFGRAVADEKIDEALVLLKGLSELAPNEPRHQFRRALLTLEHKGPAAALPLLMALTPADAPGYAPARLWLVQQALSQEPVVQLGTDDLIAQLRRATSEEPLEPTAHQLLAQLYLARNELRLAESHLVDAAARVPQLNLLLARVQRELGRNDITVGASVEAAREHFRRLLSANAADFQARIGWAQCLLQEGKIAEGEALLREGIGAHDAPELRRGLADYYAQVAALRLEQSPHNQQAAVQLVEAALAEHAANPTASELLVRLFQSRARFQADRLAPVIEDLRRQVDAAAAEGQTDVRLTVALAAALGAGAAPAEGAAILAPLATQEPQVRPLLMLLHRAAGDRAAADEVAAELTANAARRLAENPDDRDAVVQYAVHQVAAERYEDAYQTLVGYLRDTQQKVQPQPPAFRDLLARACLGRYDRTLAENPQQVDVETLREALATGALTELAIGRLAALTFADLPASDAAEKLLLNLAARDERPARIYLQLGTFAQQAQALEQAVRYLERAHASEPNDPVIKNNLAAALIAWDPGQAERALTLVNEALQRLPDHPNLLTTRAEIAIAQLQWDEAARDLNAALPHRRDSGLVHNLLSKTYAALGEADLAREHAQVAASLATEPAARSGPPPADARP